MKSENSFVWIGKDLFIINFRLDYNSAVSDEVLEEITDNLPHLQLLSLGYAGSDGTITEEVIMKIGKLKELETVR